MAAREDGEVLQHNGVEERGHQFIGRDALLLQAIDIGFGENTTLARHGMYLDPVVALITQIVGRNL